MKAMLVIVPTIALALGGCCGGCSKFWLDVQRGMYYEEGPHAEVQTVVAKTFPKKFNSTARVILGLGSSENAFTVKLRLDSDKDELRIAALTDLGNVMFAAASQGRRVGIIKNNSGWPDEVISDIVIPLCRTVTMRSLSKDCIVQKLPSGRRCYRSIDKRMEVVEVYLNEAGDGVSMILMRRFAWFGEKEYVCRIRVTESGSFPGQSRARPKRLEIVDEIGGYRAEINISSLQEIP